MKYALTSFLVVFLVSNNGFAGTKSGSAGENGTTLTSYDGPTDNIVVIIDASGSMNENIRGVRKMQAAKDALWKVLSKAPSSTHVGILVLPGRHWAYELGPRDDKMLRVAIDTIEADGGTPLGKHIKMGADALLKKRASHHGYGTYRLLIITDGQASDENLVNRYTPDVISRGITVDVIGVGMESDHTLATKVHAYRRANDPDSLEQAVSKTFAEVSDDTVSDTGEDPYEVIAHLPVGTAKAVITALATSGNHPIGTKPPKLKSTDDSGTSGGSKEEDKGGGSCNCRTSGSPGASGILLTLFVGLLLFRRRRRG